MAKTTTELEPKLLTGKEACQVLGGISRKTLWRWVQRGEIVHVILGGRRRYPVADILDRCRRRSYPLTGDLS